MGIPICGQHPGITFSNKPGKTTRLCRWHGLVFFMLILACSSAGDDEKAISIHWENDKATALEIPGKLAPGAIADSLSDWLKIIAADDSNATAILGDYRREKVIIFEPLIPFSRGLSYNVLYRNKKIGDFQIPGADPRKAPVVTAVYPALDTVPQNLLKFYVRFSQPMREGESGKHLAIVRNGMDTLHDVFLDLQPELWNAERTVITIWLDPGRIKRGLQPNEGMGSPLQENTSYTLLIAREWKDRQGRALQQAFTKSFVAGKRDSLSPDPAQWSLQIPEAGSRQDLTIDCKETLDYFLLEENLGISRQDGSEVKGSFRINPEAKLVQFTPGEPWTAGQYTLVIQSILEDLAGNNINRLFDRDIYQNKPPKSDAAYRVNFRIPATPVRPDPVARR